MNVLLKLIQQKQIKVSKIFREYEIEKSEIDRILKEGTGSKKASLEKSSQEFHDSFVFEKYPPYPPQHWVGF